MREWIDCTLGDIVTFQRGHDLPKTQMQYGRYPVVGSNGIIGYHNEYTTDEPSITIGRSGNVGKPFIYYGKTWSHNTTLYIKDFKGNDPVFVFYFLKTMDLENYAGGSAVPTLNRNHIHTLPICVPGNLMEQKKIGLLLKTIDDKIALNNAINCNLEQQAQALFKSWFSDISYFAPLSDVTINITDGVHNTVTDTPNGEYLLLSCKNIKGGKLSISKDERRIDKATFDKLRKRTKLDKGDILLSSVGTIGEILFLNSNPTNIEFQRSVAIIKADNNKISPEYLYNALKSQRRELIATAHGAVQQCIFISDIQEFEIPIPSYELVQKYTVVVSPMYERIIALQAENDRLSTLRDTLLPKLMNGEIDVSEVEI